MEELDRATGVSFNPKDYVKLCDTASQDIWEMRDELQRLAYLSAAVSWCRILPHHTDAMTNQMTKKALLEKIGTYGFIKVGSFKYRFSY